MKPEQQIKIAETFDGMSGTEGWCRLVSYCEMDGVTKLEVWGQDQCAEYQDHVLQFKDHGPYLSSEPGSKEPARFLRRCGAELEQKSGRLYFEDMGVFFFQWPEFPTFDDYMPVIREIAKRAKAESLIHVNNPEDGEHLLDISEMAGYEPGPWMTIWLKGCDATGEE